MNRFIEITKGSITELDTDAIVNAANEALVAGGGVCGAIFEAAGFEDLQAACDSIYHCDEGSAVITPGFKLKAKYIIHAVGPRWKGGNHNEPVILASAYKKALELAVKYECHSVGFPLISAGIFGYPILEAWKVAISTCQEFIDNHPSYLMKIVFAVIDQDVLKCGQGMLLRRFFSFDKLSIGGRTVDAVFFHKPEEPYGYLSNWYLSPFDLEGKRFSSVEQYIMYQKCLTFDDTVSAAKIIQTDDVSQQQTIGRNAKGYNDTVWAGIRQIVAYKGLYAKFSQNENLRQKLLETENSYLVECAGSDKIWACGVRLNDRRRKDSINWDGQNILGFALMEVRRALREEKGHRPDTLRELGKAKGLFSVPDDIDEFNEEIKKEFFDENFRENAIID